MAIEAGQLLIGVGHNETVSFSVSAPGINDPDKQLSDVQVIALKQRLRANGESIASKTLQGRVCARIALDLTTPDIDYGVLPDSNESLQEATEEIALVVARRAAHWAIGLANAIELPAAEWPEGHATPATFADALATVDAQLAEGRNI